MAMTRPWTGRSPCTTTTRAKCGARCRALSGRGFWRRSESLKTCDVSPPSSPAAKEPGKYMLVFRGALGSERDAVVGRQVFIDSVLVARLIKRSDGTPRSEGRPSRQSTCRVARSSPRESPTRRGERKLAWKPGRTVLFIPSVNFFPMYWAGASAFSSRDRGRTDRPDDGPGCAATGDHPGAADPGRVAGAHRGMHGQCRSLLINRMGSFAGAFRLATDWRIS